MPRSSFDVAPARSQWADHTNGRLKRSEASSGRRRGGITFSPGKVRKRQSATMKIHRHQKARSGATGQSVRCEIDRATERLMNASG